jgi:hypothetical protein
MLASAPKNLRPDKANAAQPGSSSTTKEPPTKASFELPPVEMPAGPPEPSSKKPPESTSFKKEVTKKIGPEEKTVKKPAEPRKPKTEPVDLRDTLRQAGFNPTADLSTLERFVRYGTAARARRALGGNQFTRMEVEKELTGHAEKIASQVYVLKGLPVSVPERQDFEWKGLFVHCPLGFRLEIFGTDPGTLPKPFRKLYGASVDTRFYYFLTKQQTLRPCLSMEEVAALRRANAIFYHPETRTTELILQLDLDFDTAKMISQQTRNYSVDLVINGLRYGKALDWGFFHRDDLLREDYNCDKLVAANDLGLADPTVPPYFQVEETRFPSLVRATLVSVQLKDSTGRSLASTGEVEGREFPQTQLKDPPGRGFASIAPTVTKVSPSSDSTDGGATVTITGSNFIGVSQVRFGATPATKFRVDSSTRIIATAPAHSATTVDITVTTAAGTSATSSADDFTYHAARGH